MTPPDKLPRHLLKAAVELFGQAGGNGAIPVIGRSMEPTLFEGHRLFVEFGTPDLVRGDLIVFLQSNDQVVHRYLGPARDRLGRPCLRTRGDGKLQLDPALARSNVLGRVVAVDRGEGWRTVRSRGARAYARLLAWHDFSWAAAGVLAARADRVLGKPGPAGPLRSVAAWADRRLLRLIHLCLFRSLHPRVEPPGVDSEAWRSRKSAPGAD